MNLTAITAHTPFASLRPLEESHREGLRKASENPDIWDHWLFDVTSLGFDAWFDYMLGHQAAGTWLPHTVFDATGREIGQTCYLDIRPQDKAVEIGGTWYEPAVHSSKVNPSCKLLLADNAFKNGAQRLTLKTDALNDRSRAAIIKLGAQFEGILRQDRMRSNGTFRDTAWFSILSDEWPEVKTRLVARLNM
jgi:N-acetyltransferase